MRKLLWIVALGAVAWCIWWAVAAQGMRGAIAGWLDARTAAGWQAEVTQIEGGGFPTTLRAGLVDLALADPDSGLALRTARLDIAAPAWWPGDVTVTLDDTPIGIATPLGRSELVMTDGVMALDLVPGTALALAALGWTADAWRVQDSDGVQIGADSLHLTMTHSGDTTYAFEARADALRPGDAARATLRLPDSVPRTFDSLQLRADVTFDTPWDRRALDRRRPQPRVIDLHLAEARWGEIVLNFAADLTVDAQGVPSGSVAIQAENWATLLEYAQNGGVLPEALRRQAQSVLGALARTSGNEQTLDVTLTLRDGAVYLGFIPLAPAPRLILR